MYLVCFLIAFPALVGFLLMLCKNDKVRRAVVIVSGGIIITAALIFASTYFYAERDGYYFFFTNYISLLMLLVEVAIGGYIICVGIKAQKYYVSLLSLFQLALILWLELSGKTAFNHEYHIYVDKLSVIMCVVIAVVGSLICLYALGYMKDYHNHHTEYKDRRPFFFGILFIFLGAMFGLVLSNHLIWMYFFWEITTFASFLLIQYTKTGEAIQNAFRALWMNLVGGCGFAIAIAYCAIFIKTLELNAVLKIGAGSPQLVVIPALFLALAGLTKSAQMPFSSWLLGAMVAPTPSSALLHSATMVKAGVYLLIRISPLLHSSIVGVMVTTIGGFTFLAASLLATSQSDAKKLLAYSTVANLGLITACAGIGLPEAVWAATLLLIFHAVSKSLMFLSVGAVENAIGSRDIEDMHGLIVRLPEMALVLIIGIAGMFLAPFGMLISKWAALKSFIDSGSMILIFFLIFGSAATLLYWTKWLGKLIAVLHDSNRLPNTVKGTEWASLLSHAAIMIALCLLFPIISRHLIEPFIIDIFGINTPILISDGNLKIMTLMLATIAILPFALRYLAFSKNNKIVASYMSGVNVGDDRCFVDSFGEQKEMYLSNWYFDKYFSEKVMLQPVTIISLAFIIVIMIVAVGGIL